MRLGTMKTLAMTLVSFGVLSGQTISTFFVGGSSGLAIDAQGNVYYTNSATSKVFKITGGVSSTFAGNGTFTYGGDGGQAVNASLNFNPSGVSGLAVDSSGNVYFSDSANNRIRKVAPGGVISTHAGNGTAGALGDNGPAVSAQLNAPTDIALDSDGNLYICDSDNNRVRKVTPGGTITTFAGNGNVTGVADGGQATASAVPSPSGIAADSQGNVYISSSLRVRKVALNGIITTLAGSGERGFSGDGGLATAAAFRGPFGLGVDQFGNVYVTDNSNGRVRKIDAAGIITTYAGIDGNASTPLGDGGPATSAYLGTVGDLMVDSAGNVYVSTGGTSNGRIRKIAAAGAGFVASPSSLTFSYTAGGANPASQTVNITSTGGVLSYTTSATSAGNWLSVSPASGAAPGTLTVSVDPSRLGGGQTYQGTILLTPTGAGNSPLSINVSLTVSGSGSPTINSGQIFNATGYQTKLAPNAVFALFGTNLGPASLVQAPAPGYPETLSGTSVKFTPLGGGTAITAKMVYTFATQIAGIIPSTITPGTYAVTVTYNSLTSAPQNVTVMARSFGIAAANSGGTGIAQATIANINGGVSLTRFTAGSVSFGGNTWTLSPAHPGDTIVLWGTGGGADLQNDSGGSSGDQTAEGNFVVTVGTRQITPQYAGTSFGYPGLFQINVQLPTDLAVDCFTTVKVTAGGEVSNTVVIPIAAVGQGSCTDATMPASILSKLDAGTNINFGAFALAKVTQTTSNITQETASGSVFSFTPTQWTILNSGPVFGACRLYDRTYPLGGKDPGSPEAFLNAGTRLGLSGPNLAAGSGLTTITSVLGPAYGTTFTSGTFSSGSYTISGTGGTDVGAFSSTAAFPTSFNATNFAGITAINRSQPLTFTWTGTGIDQVTLILTSSVTTGGSVRITTLNCNVPSGPGTYAVSAAALATLQPAGVTGSAIGSVTISGINTQGKFTANLTKGGQLDLGNFWPQIGFSKNIAVQ